MYNSQKPTAEELPSSAQLIKSTILAFVTALLILVTVILPSEYNIDPTGVGEALGLREMGEIKEQLAAEAAADNAASTPAAPSVQTAPSAPVITLKPKSDQQSNLMDQILGLIVSEANAQAQTQAQAQAPAQEWRDELGFTLQPGQGVEIKLVMNKGAVADYAWKSEGGVANFDLHGDGGGNKISYEKGRFVPGASGQLTAAFDGNHGWFWRNRDKQPIQITLQVKGDYLQLRLPK